MKRIFKLLVFFLPIFYGLDSTAQRNKKDSATYCITRAINLEDQGKPADAIAWIRKAQKLEPKNINHDYELAYAYFLNKNLDQAIAILEKLLPRPTVNGKIYQLLGNTYDESGNPDKAMETYRAGLQRFPGSGELYLESGIIYLKRKDYDSAVSTFEKGIEMDPGFSSNYYRAAKLYLSSNEKVWGMIYGELFMLLEPMSERSKELSRLLYETYKKQIALAGYGQAKAYFANRVIPDSIANQASLVKQTNFARKIYDGLLADAFKTRIEPGRVPEVREVADQEPGRTG
ncbi:MAG: tetratricopeptide repeat protein [Chitinophagaceae bacterium]|nr:tetratricopeptide repeat protein [Chitinophagaceae bacterium]